MGSFVPPLVGGSLCGLSSSISFYSCHCFSPSTRHAADLASLSTNPYDPDSTSNPYGRYGSPFSPDSIKNPFGAGNPYSPSSPTNPYGHGLRIKQRTLMIAGQRAPRDERHSDRTWLKYYYKSKWAAPVIGGSVRTVTHSQRWCEWKNRFLELPLS